MQSWIVVLGLASVATCAHAENMVVNPSAEQTGTDRRPRGWGLYVGAGNAKLVVAAEEKRSGQASACLALSGWHVPAGAKDPTAARSASAAIVLAENDGYSAKGSLRAVPGTTYAYSFWYKGDLPAASVGVTGWPADDADHTKRIMQSVSTAAVRPGSAWQRCAGTFRVAEGVRRFVLMIQVSGRPSDGFPLGKLYVDDVEIVPKSFPDGQLRAIWCGPPKATERGQGLKEISANLDRLKACGLNTLLVWTESRYIAALDRAELRQAEPSAAWDSLGELIQAAKQRAMQVHVWYSPWIYKSGRAVELREHPEWSAVNASGVVDKDGVCLARPEVRRFELDLMARLVDRYPDLAGLHIEEPGYNWDQFCYCDHCKRLCRDWYGVDIVRDPIAARPLLDHLAASMCTDFFIRLRQMLLAKRPQMWLSANGSGGENVDADWRIGRDWPTWARRGYIDFYVPQLYTKSPDAFVRGALKTKEQLGPCDLVTGLAVSWSGIYPERQTPAVIQEEIRAAKKLGAKGFVVFHLDHFKEEHFPAIRQAIQDRPPPTKP